MDEIIPLTFQVAEGSLANMKMITSVLLILSCLLLLFGCNTKSNTDGSAEDGSVVTSSAEVVEYETVQSKYFGELKRSVDEDGHTFVYIEAEKWPELSVQDLNESFGEEYTADYNNICSICDYICLDLGVGRLSIEPNTEEFTKSLINMRNPFDIELSTPFNHYKYIRNAAESFPDYGYVEISDSVVKFKNPAVFAEEDALEPINNFSAYAYLLWEIRIIYGIKPESIVQPILGSGLMNLVTFMSIEGDNCISMHSKFSRYNLKTGSYKWE